MTLSMALNPQGPVAAVDSREPDGRLAGCRAPGPGARRAFTLVEIVLVMALIVLLAGISIINWKGMLQGRVLEEGASRMETALRMARAEAANQGKRLQIVFDADGRTFLNWEPDPLGSPGVFADYAMCTWKQFLPADNIRVIRSAYVGSSTYRTAAADTGSGSGGADEVPMAPITFEPDGSSDSVEIRMAMTDGSEARQAVVTLDGLTGRIVTSLVTVGADGSDTSIDGS
jgi:prepilin-type N-terminal cleavage/methylation domain-containing protein